MAGLERARVAFLLKGYPRLSESFIAQEIAALERRGLEILIVSLRQPTEGKRHPVHAEIRAQVKYLPEYLHRAPARVLRAWWHVRRWPRYRSARSLWLRDLMRDPTPNRMRRFFQALVLADELPADVHHLHAHFLHTPASVARYAAVLCDVPWSGSAHAKDIWTSPEWDKREKLASCAWLVTCTTCNLEHLSALAPPGRVQLVHHGLDRARFPAHRRPMDVRNGGQADAPVTILSVGRLVEKKGTDVLLESLARLPAYLHWRLVHVGGGPLKEALEQRAQALGISARVAWRGALDQRALLMEYRSADLFALACRVTSNGDRDGLPNVLMEAQSQGLACVATEVSAIPELILNDLTGVLVPPEAPQRLAAALAALITDPQRRFRLGNAGRERVAAAFGFEDNIDRLAARFALSASPGVVGALRAPG